MDWIISLLTLTALEIVLGIDNIVLISIVVEKLPENQREKARKIGLLLALLARILLLSLAFWMTKLTEPLFHLLEHSFSARDIILLLGGLFLLTKATTEIFNFVERKDQHGKTHQKVTTYSQALLQIIVFDLIFSLDSVLTAVGLTKHLSVMILSVILAILTMLIFAKSIGDFVQKNPGIKMLALSFLILIAVLLIAESFGSHMERGYVYFAMSFSLVIELLNRRRLRNEVASFQSKEEAKT